MNKKTLILLAGMVIPLLEVAQAVPYVTGDVFAGVSNGNVNHYSSTGILKGTYNIGTGGFTTGMAFDGAGNLYATGFSASTLAQFDNAGNRLSANFAAGLATPESVVFDSAGSFYVGNLGNGIRKYDAAGSFLGTVVNTRVDWFDLSADQTTFFYGTEGTAVHTVSNALPGVSGPDFASGLTNAFAMRLLSDGSLLVADRANVKRFDSTGSLVQSYDVAGEDSWFSLNLDPDGTSFWSGNFGTANIYKFNIASGAQLFDFNTGTGSGTLFGLTVFGEITQGGSPPPPPPPTSSVPDGGATVLLLGSSLFGLGILRRRFLAH